VLEIQAKSAYAVARGWCDDQSLLLEYEGAPHKACLTTGLHDFLKV
jgi:hypothetical protein